MAISVVKGVVLFCILVKGFLISINAGLLQTHSSLSTVRH